MSMDGNGAERLLPMIAGGSGGGWDSLGGSDSGTGWGKAPPKKEPKPLPVPGPKQQAKAELLARGLSAANRRVSDGQVETVPSSHLQQAMQEAKEWRKRLEDTAAKRAVRAVPLKVQTVAFDGGFPP